MKTFFVAVYDGGGSMSECATHRALFGPFTLDEAQEVERLLDQTVSTGFDDSQHVRILDTARTSDLLEYIEANRID